MNRDRREAEKAARRARRLAERAEERASRKERQAQRAAERAERLAERASRRPQRERDLDRSIEDLVDDMTHKAERWIDEQTRSLFRSAEEEEREVARAEGEARRARAEADKARTSADRAGRAADDLSSLGEDLGSDHSFGGFEDADLDDGGLYSSLVDDGLYGMGDEDYDPITGEPTSRSERRARREARRRARKERRYGYGRDDGSFWHDFDWGHQGWYGSSRKRARRRKSAHLYRDKQRKKVMGVCAGLADYWGRPVWEVRVFTVVGLFIIPTVVVPAYFIMAFLMDDKPYYRRVTDRFEEPADASPEPAKQTTRQQRREERKMKREARRKAQTVDEATSSPMDNVQAMKAAKEKFADIEQRLRQMETHVTSDRFELQREFKKISGED
ncbi:MAG: PspC domain-containing protein [Roseibium sp.]|nr:PspC domain-containing protein [Roseibium sp.]